MKTLKKLNKFGKVKENKKLFYENVFAKIPQEGEEVTALDLISNLEASEELGITPQQVSTTKNIVKQTIANCLTEMVTDNVLDQYSDLLDKFYDVPNVASQIRQEYEYFMNPYVIKDRTQAAETFCKIEPDQLQEVTQ